MPPVVRYGRFWLKVGEMIFNRPGAFFYPFPPQGFIHYPASYKAKSNASFFFHPSDNASCMCFIAFT